MKSVATFFAIFIVASIKAQSSQNYSDIAAQLLLNVTDTISALDLDVSKVDEELTGLQTTVSQLDFGIPRDPQIVKLKQSLKKIRGKGSIACKILMNDSVSTVTKSLQEIVYEGMKKQLTNNKNNLLETREKLENISVNVQGTQLEEEIKVCDATPEECKLVYVYPQEVEHDKEFIIAINAVTVSVLNNIIKTVITPMLGPKVSTIIIAPVSACIKHALETEG